MTIRRSSWQTDWLAGWLTKQLTLWWSDWLWGSWLTVSVLLMWHNRPCVSTSRLSDWRASSMSSYLNTGRTGGWGEEREGLKPCINHYKTKRVCSSSFAFQSGSLTRSWSDHLDTDESENLHAWIYIRKINYELVWIDSNLTFQISGSPNEGQRKESVKVSSSQRTFRQKAWRVRPHSRMTKRSDFLL